jgi:NADP-dependent 3-hydroxy acid dehydrogenase YdfG
VGALDGRTTLVAGASSGIGLATALAFADAGARVHAAARRVELIQNAAGGRDITAHPLDITDSDAIAAIVERVDPLHALVVATGINIRRRRLDQLEPDAVERLMAANLTGAMNLVQACLQALRATRGHVVLIGSVSGSWPDRSGPAYQASKAGLLGFARGAAFEERDVRFTTIMPGVVDTAILNERPEPPDAEQRALMLLPEDVAAACLFVVSLPARAAVPELTILPAALQALGRTG